jgi:hypothetical protein
MSTVTVKKRGRPKKEAINLEEEALVVEQSSKPKPRKSTLKTQTVKETKELASSLSVPTKTAENAPTFQSQVKRGANGKNTAAAKLGNSDPAKQKALSTAGSAILQKATAFTTVTEPKNLANGEALGLNEPDQIPIESSIQVSGVESNTTAANDLGTIQQQKPSISIKEQEPELEAAGDISGADVQEFERPSPITSAAPAVIKEDPAPAPILQHSNQEPAAPMGNGSPSSLPSSEGAQAVAPIKNTTAISSPVKSESPSTALPKIPSTSGPRLPSSFAAAPLPPPPPRPTQLPYHELKKNPEFKALSRKYTSLIIAIPIALFTSYILWGRCKS